VLRDTTEARNAVLAQEALLLAVTQAMEARTRLLRGVTHDVKNPLGAADGYAQLLELELRGTLLPEQEKWVAGVRRGIGGALALITDLLDLSLAESGGLPVTREAVDLGLLAAEALEEHRGAAEAAGHVLTREGDARVPVHTRCSATSSPTRSSTRPRRAASRCGSNGMRSAAQGSPAAGSPPT